MAVTKIRKISSWNLLIVCAISIAVLALFYLGGEGSPINEKKNPVYTGELLSWAYTILGLCTFCLVTFGLIQFMRKFKTNPKAAIMSLSILIVFAVILVIAYSIGDSTPLSGINTDSQKYNIASWLKLTDMWLYTTYILLFLSICSMALGSIKKIVNK